jgi:hypothetical protein
VGVLALPETRIEGSSVMERELESARDWAVLHEQNAAEYGRRVNVALSYLEEMGCECTFAEFTFGQRVYPCPRHELEAILKGDQ